MGIVNSTKDPKIKKWVDQQFSLNRMKRRTEKLRRSRVAQSVAAKNAYKAGCIEKRATGKGVLPKK